MIEDLNILLRGCSERDVRMYEEIENHAMAGVRAYRAGEISQEDFERYRFAYQAVRHNAKGRWNPLYRSGPVPLVMNRGPREFWGILEDPTAAKEHVPEILKILGDKTLPPILRAAKVYQDLLTAHLFYDANGRTSRLLCDYVLLSSGLPPALLRTDNPNLANPAAIETWEGDQKKEIPATWEDVLPLSCAVSLIDAGVQESLRIFRNFGIDLRHPRLKDHLFMSRQEIDRLTYWSSSPTPRPL